MAPTEHLRRKPSGRTTDRDRLASPVWPLPAAGTAPDRVEICRSARPVAYGDALDEMDRNTAGIFAGTEPEKVWLLEHPPLYTGGTRSDPADLLDPDLFPVYRTGRGGEYTYHGPGQRVAYVMLDLSRRSRDIRRFVAALESWTIGTLARFGVTGERREDRVGVWVKRPDKPLHADGSVAEDKIAAIGVRVRKWVTFHGISVNVSPDLSHYRGIVPCGIAGHGVTSLQDLGIDIGLEEFDRNLMAEFEPLFGPATAVNPRI